MKTLTFPFLAALFLLFSCSKYDDNNSNNNCTDKPLENIPWLKQLVDNETDPNNEDSSGLEIIQYQLNGETVFLVDSCINNCADSLVAVYDCEKNVVCEFGGIIGLNTCPDFDTEATNRVVLFTSKEASPCDDQKNDNTEITEVGYGTSFGFCLGYCVNKAVYTSDSAEHTRSDNRGELEILTCTTEVTTENWEKLQTGINTCEFFELPEVIGCPDCADGGAEWIEIKLSSGETHRVTFEFSNEPRSLKSYATELRKQTSISNMCLPDTNN